VLEVVLASTTKTFATLEPTFANNLGPAPVTFFQQKQVSFPWQNLPTDPDQPSLWLLGDQPFVFTGPHFLVQVDTQTSSPPQTLGYWVNAYTMTPTSIVNASSGRSCGGRLTATLYTNGVFDFELASAAANQPAWFLFSNEQTRLSGGVGLPYDLTLFGMPGCRLGVDPFASIAAATNASGFARLRTQLPPLASQYFVLHTQALHGGATNAAGYATTNVLHSVLGYGELSTYLYNWDQFGPVAQYGPAVWNQGAMVLIRP
jgi:hypothetical protein